MECFVAPCEFASCPAFPFARCVDDYCGGCNARFYLHNGEEVTEDCEGGENLDNLESMTQ